MARNAVRKGKAFIHTGVERSSGSGANIFRSKWRSRQSVGFAADGRCSATHFKLLDFVAQLGSPLVILFFDSLLQCTVELIKFRSGGA